MADTPKPGDFVLVSDRYSRRVMEVTRVTPQRVYGKRFYVADRTSECETYQPLTDVLAVAASREQAFAAEAAYTQAVEGRRAGLSEIAERINAAEAERRLYVSETKQLAERAARDKAAEPRA
jgi:hypothetical protein